MFKNKIHFSPKGFTLVELLVVIGLLGVLVIMAIAIFDPVAQFGKAKDAQRKHDFEQIRNALDAYYNDFNCYPQVNSVPFGSQWSAGNIVYMKKVPQDPDCSTTGYCYIYQTDNAASCPQWNVLWARFSRPTNALTSCLIRNTCNTYPNLKYNYCLMSGLVDCPFVKSNTSAFDATPGGPGGGGPISTPTPTPIQGIDCKGHYYAVSPYSGQCNDLLGDNNHFCSIHGGTQGYICYSAGGFGTCGGTLCSK